jgi:hypothetical protein
MPDWKRSLGERLDDSIVPVVPDVNKAVKLAEALLDS